MVVEGYRKLKKEAQQQEGSDIWTCLEGREPLEDVREEEEEFI